MEKINVTGLKNVSETLLIPLYFKAKETTEEGLLFDPVAVKAVEKIGYDFNKFHSDRLSQTGVTIRTILFDLILENLSKTHPDLIVVNLGAGLDTRPERHPDFQWFNIDFKEVIEVREQVFKETNSTNFSQSIFDFSWIGKIPRRSHILFIAEGVLMYLEESLVKQLFLKLSSEFSESYVAFDTIPKFMVGRRHSSVNTNTAPFKWGNSNLEDIMRWDRSLSAMNTYRFGDFFKEKWGWMRLVYFIPVIKKGFKVAVVKLK